MEYWSPPRKMIARSGIEEIDFAYLYLAAYPCGNQMAFARAASPISMRASQTPSAVWKLLISADVSENVNHTWGKYEAMSGKLQELANTAMSQVAGGESIGKGILTGQQPSGNSVNLSNGSISDRVNSTMNFLANSS